MSPNAAPYAPSPPVRSPPRDAADERSDLPPLPAGVEVPVAPPWPATEPAAAERGGRDVALDLLRGLAMVILVVNHVHLESVLQDATRAVLSAAEVLVAVSGVVVGMVFGRRWRTAGARATTLLLLRRSRKLYVASVVVVALVGLLTLVPGLATDALTVSPRNPDRDLYDFGDPLRTVLAIVTLEAGPWQFNILGYFIAALAAAPAVLWALARGWWPAVLAASWALYVAGRAWPVDVSMAQSEGPFPLLIWQLLFVHGIVLGWYRERIARFVRASRGTIAGVVVAAALAGAFLQLHHLGYGPADWARWQAEHFDKASLDILRVMTMIALAGAIYLALRRLGAAAERALGWLLLPLGRNSFYVFIMHVFLCLAVASVPAFAGAGLGLAGNSLVQVACLAILTVMVRREFLFRWVPR